MLKPKEKVYLDINGNEIKTSYPFLIWSENNTEAKLEISVSPLGQFKTVLEVLPNNQLKVIFDSLSKKINVSDFVKFAYDGLNPENYSFNSLEVDLYQEYKYDDLLKEFDKKISDYRPLVPNLTEEIQKELRKHFLQDVSLALLEAIYQNVIYRLVLAGHTLAIFNFAISGDIAYDPIFRRMLLNNIDQDITLYFEKST